MCQSRQAKRQTATREQIGTNGQCMGTTGQYIGTTGSETEQCNQRAERQGEWTHREYREQDARQNKKRAAEEKHSRKDVCQNGEARNQRAGTTTDPLLT